MSTDYQAYFPTLLPTFIADDVGTYWATSFGFIGSAIADGASNAVKCSIVQMAPSDALPYLGAARPHIIRYPGESDASYQSALAQSFCYASLLGTDAGIIAALGRVGMKATVIRNNEWDWDGHPGNVAPYWARMWVIIQQPSPFSPGSRWGGGGRWGSDFVWGPDGLTPQIQQFIIDVCETYKSSHSQLVRIRLILDGTAWGAGFTWGGTFAWGGDYVDIYEG